MVDDPGAGVSNDGLWSPGKRDAPLKSEEDPVAVPEAVKGEVPQKPTALVREGAADEGFFSFAFVVLAVLCAGVFVVWKKNKKDRRRES